MIDTYRAVRQLERLFYENKRSPSPRKTDSAEKGIHIATITYYPDIEKVVIERVPRNLS